MNLISGKSEFDIFKNYYTAEKSESCKSAVNNSTLQSKDNAKSALLRVLVKRDFTAKEYYDCLAKYTRSLSYATFNGREYALALANRSATYFALKQYENCLIDINLSLQGDYPTNLKPKMLIRKAKCFIEMGNFKKMVETIDDCCRQMDNYSDLSKIDKENYQKEMKSLLDIKRVDMEEFLSTETWAPEVILEKNRLNPNVSAAIKWKFNRNTGMDYIAARDISCGEVLFVDRAYSISSSTMNEEVEDSLGIFYCNHCWNEAKNCIPCKICVTFVYCSEECLNNSWTEYHKWECDMFRSKIISDDLHLPVRTMIKAALSGVIFQIRNDSKPYKPSQDVNPYLHIYGFPVDFARFRSKSTGRFVEICEKTSLAIEFLKRTNFFTDLMSMSSCKKDHPTLVNFIGGLIIKHTIQVFQRSLVVHKFPSSILSVNDYHEEFDYCRFVTNFLAFCPAVSGLRFSCDSNTNIYFNGSTCIVKACKNIKAGNCISRSGLNLTPMVSYFKRQVIFDEFDLNCDCTACESISNNVDILDTFLCFECEEFSVLIVPLMNMQQPLLVCNNCKSIICVETLDTIFNFAFFYLFVRGNLHITHDGEKAIALGLNNLKNFFNPFHVEVYNLLKEIMMIYLQRGNFRKFNEVLHEFKTCAENRNGRFHTLKFLFDLVFICNGCCTYMQRHKTKLQKEEILEMVNYCFDVIKKGKRIAEFTFPPFLHFFGTVELYLLKLRISYVYLS